MDVQIKPMSVGTLLLWISLAPGSAQALYQEAGSTT
jgi:subtilase-type serine protease